MYAIFNLHHKFLYVGTICIPTSMISIPAGPIGILLSGTELLDSPIRMEFSTGLVHAVFIQLTTEYSSDCRVQQVWTLMFLPSLHGHRLVPHHNSQYIFTPHVFLMQAYILYSMYSIDDHICVLLYIYMCPIMPHIMIYESFVNMTIWPGQFKSPVNPCVIPSQVFLGVPTCFQHIKIVIVLHIIDIFRCHN